MNNHRMKFTPGVYTWFVLWCYKVFIKIWGLRVENYNLVFCIIFIFSSNKILTEKVN